jgi:hypothetical protein
MKGIVVDVLSPMKITCKINYKEIRVWGRSIDHGWICVNPWWVCDPIFAQNCMNHTKYLFMYCETHMKHVLYL